MEGAFLVLIAIFVSLFMSKIIKIFFYPTIREAMLAGGGMPSSHCASATALVSMIYFVEGFTTTFVLALSFAAVVLVDAVRVRRAVGLNADMMKKILHKKDHDDVMVEHGHTIPEAVWGCILGLVVSVAIAIVVLG